MFNFFKKKCDHVYYLCSKDIYFKRALKARILSFNTLINDSSYNPVYGIRIDYKVCEKCRERICEDMSDWRAYGKYDLERIFWDRGSSGKRSEHSTYSYNNWDTILIGDEKINNNNFWKLYKYECPETELEELKVRFKPWEQIHREQREKEEADRKLMEESIKGKDIDQFNNRRNKEVNVNI